MLTTSALFWHVSGFTTSNILANRSASVEILISFVQCSVALMSPYRTKHVCYCSKMVR